MSTTACRGCGEQIPVRARFCPFCGETAARKSPLSPGKLAVSAMALVAIVGAGIAFFKALPFHPHPVIELQPVVAPAKPYGVSRTDMVQVPSRVEGDWIVLSLRDVLENRVVGFDYAGGALPVSMLSYVTPGGKLVTSIAFCEPCNSRRYHAENDELICNACGTTWKMENLEGISGACQKYPPDPIPSVVVGDEVRIDVAAVKGWKSRL